jgi:hypothetical protein
MSDLKRALLARSAELDANPDQFAALFRVRGVSGAHGLSAAVTAAMADEYRALAGELGGADAPC